MLRVLQGLGSALRNDCGLFIGDWGLVFLNLCSLFFLPVSCLLSLSLLPFFLGLASGFRTSFSRGFIAFFLFETLLTLAFLPL